MRRPLCLLSLAFAVILALCLQVIPKPVLTYEEWDGQAVSLEGQVYKKEYRDTDTLILYLTSIHILNVSNDSVQVPNEKKQNIMCYMKKGSEPAMGSKVRIKGIMKCFNKATNPGEFDLRSYYRVMKIEARIDNGILLACGSYSNIRQEGLYRLKGVFSRNLEDCFGEKQAGIMKAMLLGDKGSLDQEVKELYKQSGIIHILAISGLHISMIGMGLYRLLRKLGLSVKAGACLSVTMIWCYGVMTGMGPSAVRAIVMFTLRLTADMIGRTYDMLTAMAVAAILLLIDQPRYIYYSGFLFSFGAVLAMGTLLPSFSSNKSRGKGKKVRRLIESMKQAAASGASVTLLTLPIHLMTYFQFPIYSIFLNLLVIPLMSAVMLFGLFCMLAGSAFPFASGMAAHIVTGILSLYENLCLISGKLPNGNWITGQPELWQTAVYIIMLAVLIAIGKKVSGFWKGQWILLALLILLFRNEDGLSVTAIDVGQGDGIHINNNGTHYLIDGGSTSKSKVADYQMIPYFKSQGVSKLVAVFVTHADEDHCNGVRTLLSEADQGGIKIGCLILPDIGTGSRDKAYRRMIETAEENSVAVHYMGRGERVEEGRMKLTCLHPYDGFETAKPNEYSLVLYLEYGNFTGLFAGDIEGKGEQLLKQYIEGDKKKELILLKTAHHGSGNSTDEEFLKLLSPKNAFISCGKNNRYGHPDQKLLERLNKINCKAYITKDIGAVTAYTDGRKMSIKAYLTEK